MSYAVRIESFEGPLDLLLQLVESAQLEITNVSLMQVTEPFVQHVRENQGKIPPEELADFLLVAAKLVYLKSKALLPTLNDPTLEEGPDLATQLKMYQAFVEAARRLGQLAKERHTSFSRSKPLQLEQKAGFVPPKDVTAEVLQQLYQRVLKRLQPLANLPKAAIERAISLEEKIQHLSDRVQRTMRTSFHRFLAESQDRMEMVVGFLALLELIKRRVVHIEQNQIFDEIHLHASEENM